MPVERRRYTQQDGVRLGGTGEIRCGLKAFFVYRSFYSTFVDVTNIRVAGLKGIDFGWVNIQPKYGKPDLGETKRQRKTNVSHSDDANCGPVIVNSFYQLVTVGFRHFDFQCIFIGIWYRPSSIAPPPVLYRQFGSFRGNSGTLLTY